MTARLALFTAALLGTFAIHAGAQAGPPYEYQQIPGASPAPITANAGLKSRAELEAFLDGVMDAHMKQNNIAGAQLAVVKDGEIFFAKGYGYADVAKRTPVDPATTLFRPGSVSKMITWTAVMQLVEQGKLDLDTDVNTYLKHFKLPDTFDAPITLRNLLTHTPGLEDGGVGYLFVKKPEDMKPLAESLAEHIPTRVRPPTTDFAKGGQNASYSNFGTALAGVIVEDVSGMSFDDYLDKNIFQPLGMTHSTFRQPLPAELAPHMAIGYSWKNGEWEPYKHDFEIVQFAPAGSMSASTNDMAQFLIAHLNLGELNGQRILKEETAKLMQSRQFSPSPNVNGSALGFFETWLNGRRIITHWGDTLTFHTSWNLLPAENVGVYFSYNTSSEGVGDARRDLLRAFMDRYYPATLPQVTPPADFKERAAQYVGTYGMTRHSHTTVEKMFGLAGGAKVVPTEDNTLMVVAGGEAAQYVEIAPDTFRLVDRDENIVFFRNDAGAITGFSVWLSFVAFEKLGLAANPALHQFILGFGLLCFIVALVSAIRNRGADAAGDAGARRARRLAGALGAVLILFLIALLGAIAAGIEELFFGFPPAFKAALVLPLLAIPLALGAAWFTVQAWKNSWWTRYGRVQYSVIALFGLLFLWSLHTYNLLGWNFG